MRTLAIDPGQRRVGLALSDEGGRLATPLEVVDAAQAVERIAGIVKREGVARIIIGLPLNMDGSRGASAKSAEEFGRGISARCGLAVLFVDERLSSFAAEQELNDQKRQGAKMTRKMKKQRQDALAAARFLQDFLDGKIHAV